MSVISVQTSDTFEQWRVKTNNISALVGDIAQLVSGEGNLVTAINNVRDIDVNIALTGEVTGSGTSLNLGNASIALTITNGSVVTAKIADSNVTTAKLADSAVTTIKIADSNVTTAKIADSNVTTIKIADSNVTTAKVADSNITTAKIANDNVTAAKLKSTVTLQILNSAGTALKTLYGAGA